MDWSTDQQRGLPIANLDFSRRDDACFQGSVFPEHSHGLIEVLLKAIVIGFSQFDFKRGRSSWWGPELTLGSDSILHSERMAGFRVAVFGPLCR